MTIATIYTTCADRAEASQLGRTLVTEKLAACANILSDITSIYFWAEKLEESSESVLLLKTRPELIAAITGRIRELHSYECPCVVAWESAEGNPDYFQWVFAETARPAATPSLSPANRPECEPPAR